MGQFLSPCVCLPCSRPLHPQPPPLSLVWTSEEPLRARPRPKPPAYPHIYRWDGRQWRGAKNTLPCAPCLLNLAPLPSPRSPPRILPLPSSPRPIACTRAHVHAYCDTTSLNPFRARAAAAPPPLPSGQACALRAGRRGAAGWCVSRIRLRGPRPPTEVRRQRWAVLREATVSSSICVMLQGPRLLPLRLNAHRNPPLRPLSPLHPLGSGWGWSRGASWRTPRQRCAIASWGATVSPRHPNGCTFRPQSRRRGPLEELEGAN